MHKGLGSGLKLQGSVLNTLRVQDSELRVSGTGLTTLRVRCIGFI